MLFGVSKKLNELDRSNKAQKRFYPCLLPADEISFYKLFKEGLMAKEKKIAQIFDKILYNTVIFNTLRHSITSIPTLNVSVRWLQHVSNTKFKSLVLLYLEKTWSRLNQIGQKAKNHMTPNTLSEQCTLQKRIGMDRVSSVIYTAARGEEKGL